MRKQLLPTGAFAKPRQEVGISTVNRYLGCIKWMDDSKEH